VISSLNRVKGMIARIQTVGIKKSSGFLRQTSFILIFFEEINLSHRLIKKEITTQIINPDRNAAARSAAEKSKSFIFTPSFFAQGSHSPCGKTNYKTKQQLTP